jgi:hypothetical protein
MNAQQMRRNAEHCLDAANGSADEVQRLRFIRAAKAWRSLAHSKHQADIALVSEEFAEPESERQVA